MKLVAAALLIVGGALLAGCATHHAATPTPRTTAPSVTVPPSTPAPLVASPAETCQALTDMDVLESAEGFVLVGGAVEPGDVTNTVISLRSVQRLAATEFQAALSNIIGALEDLDAAVTDGTGGTVDMSTVGPDSNLLAGMCRSRGLPIPAVI